MHGSLTSIGSMSMRWMKRGAEVGGLGSVGLHAQRLQEAMEALTDASVTAMEQTASDNLLGVQSNL